MAYIEIYPQNLRAQVTLKDKEDLVFDLLVDCVKKVFQVPENDIIVALHECSTISFNRSAVALDVTPDVLLKLNTNDVQFKEKAEELKDMIIDQWDYLLGKVLKVECWINFFHTWGCNIEFE